MRMLTRSVLSVTVLWLVPMLAWGDEPPPPDTYSGPSVVHVAGLTFERDEVGALGNLEELAVMHNDQNPLDYGGPWVFLTGCDDGHPNCVLAKRSGAIGGAVSTVNGDELEGGDAGALKKAFDDAAQGKPVRLVLLFAGHKHSLPRPLKSVTIDLAAQ